MIIYFFLSIFRLGNKVITKMEMLRTLVLLGHIQVRWFLFCFHHQKNNFKVDMKMLKEKKKVKLPDEIENLFRCNNFHSSPVYILSFSVWWTLRTMRRSVRGSSSGPRATTGRDSKTCHPYYWSIKALYTFIPTLNQFENKAQIR